MLAVISAASARTIHTGRAARGVEHRLDCAVDVDRVHPGERVAGVHGYAVGQAGCEPQYSALASAAGKVTVIDGGYHRRPVDRGQPRSAKHLPRWREFSAPTGKGRTRREGPGPRRA